MWNDLGEYIVTQCNSNIINRISDSSNSIIDISSAACSNSITNNENSAFKVVEIAIGKFFQVADYLKNYNSNVINFTATDINPANSDIIFDDITEPNMEIYDGADLIYSIRPPQELQPYIADIISKTRASLIIKPLFNEDLNLKLPMQLVNFKKAIFYQSI